MGRKAPFEMLLVLKAFRMSRATSTKEWWESSRAEMAWLIIAIVDPLLLVPLLQHTLTWKGRGAPSV